MLWYAWYKGSKAIRMQQLRWCCLQRVEDIYIIKRFDHNKLSLLNVGTKTAKAIKLGTTKFKKCMY